MKSKTKRPRIALVLQGGGAIGAYQAGIYQALHEHDLAPDWVVGTSIGAINAALIAGNHHANRVGKLREFWNRIAHKDVIDMTSVPDEARHANTLQATLDATIRGVPGFFVPRMFNLFPLGLIVAADDASFYNTAPLKQTLTELIDFDYLNTPGDTRLTVNAVNVTSGKLVSFDSSKTMLGTEHVMASGALPPGFPPIRIKGELYWDGGLYSNTPLETVLDDAQQIDTLCFMVDLWSAAGPEPTTLDHVQTRQKDVMYASRSQKHIDAYSRTHDLQHMVHSLYQRLPAELRTEDDKHAMRALACDTTIHVVRIPYGGQDWQMASKDINFSKGSIDWRWEQGYNDALRAIKQASWLDKMYEHAGIVVHELPPIIHAER